MPRIALIVDDTDWHARTLLAAFAALGADAVPLRLADCRFDTASPHGLTLPGVADGALPDAVLVRSFGGGGFEAVTRRLGLLHALRDLGVTVWNDARAIERCVDKSTTSFRLARDGIPTPATWTVEGIEAARSIVRAAGGGRLVCKPLFGAQGVGLRLVASIDDLPPPEAVGDIYHLQRYVPTGRDSFCDHRVFVIGGEAVAAMTRRASHWITNVRRGARPEPLADPELCALAVRAAASMGASYAGVDLLRDADGTAMVLEVNSMPGWKGLQSVTETDIADHLARGVLALPLRSVGIAGAFRAACADELDAIKPGNVHVHADGHGMVAADFRRSAAVAAGPLCAPGAALGRRVLSAIQATRDAVGQNTNLGILLLCAPLAMAAEAAPAGLQAALREVLQATTLQDTQAVFDAIALAAPGGLGGAARHDVRAPATVGLVAAMAEAADRDRIARQYATGFADIFGQLTETYAAARARHAHWPDAASWAVAATFLSCLAAWPDSHVARKHGLAVAEAVRLEATGWQQRLVRAESPAAVLADLITWDSQLKRRQINPGTSADLTVATIFVHRLRNSLPCCADDG